MLGFFQKLHTAVPEGQVVVLPVVGENGDSSVPGIWIAGDLTGIALMKYAANQGTTVVDRIYQNLKKNKSVSPQLPQGTYETAADRILDLAIVGGGVAGMSAGLRAEELGMEFRIYESETAFATIADFPNGKPIYLYPEKLTNKSSLPLKGISKETLWENLRSNGAVNAIVRNKLIRQSIHRVTRQSGLFQLEDDRGNMVIRAKQVLVAIGKGGGYKTLAIQGMDLSKVHHRLDEPSMYRDKSVAVVGGGDSAVEAAIALSRAGAKTTLIHRGENFPRIKNDNREALEALEVAGGIQVYRNSRLGEVRESSVVVIGDSGKQEKTLVLKNDSVFVMIGREISLDFFRRSGIDIVGDWTGTKLFTLLGVLGFCIGLYHWKMDGSLIQDWFRARGLFPFALEFWRSQFHPAQGLPYIWATNLVSPSFYYALAYTILVLVFGIRRVVRNPTPYVRTQTVVLFLIQLIPLFLLPFFLLPLVGHWGGYDGGFGKLVGDELFPRTETGLGREYWRAFGLVLAFPLFIWNVFSGGPLLGWLIISFFQTFVLIPWIVWKWGKGGYCGWICSCGALAETLGDVHRGKMPHGPIWNRWNYLGQGILLLAFLLLAARLGSWFFPSILAYPLGEFFSGFLYGWFPFTYYYMVDVWLAGILGVGLYFHFSGRMWCRFACPLAALMHIYARFSRFRIFSDKKKCISCNLCTSQCHQGIDVMGYANQGLPMEDPQCVRCSACVSVCPTGVLTFGRLGQAGEVVPDRIPARRKLT